MHDPMTFERKLADAYDRWASEMPIDVDALTLVRATRGHAVADRRVWPFRSLRIVLLLALLGALAIAAAIWLASRHADVSRPLGSAYRAVVARTVAEPDRIDIVAIRPDGWERVITSLPAPDGDQEIDLRLSPTGWLAIGDTAGWRLISLREPTNDARAVPSMAGARGQSWIPDGRFALWQESGSMQLTDPVTATSETVSVTPPTYDIDAWTADGSGFVQGGDGPLSFEEQPWDGDRRVVYLDGRPDETTIPALDPWLSMGKGAAGMRLRVCDPSGDGPCPNLPSGAVVGEAADGTLTTWYRDELAPDALVDAMFTREGTAMWLLLDRREGGHQFVLARKEAGGDATVVLSGGLPSDDHPGPWQMRGVAPDDSLVMVWAGAPILIEPRTGRTRVVEGSLLGFVPDDEVDTWAGGSFVSMQPVASLLPRSAAWPTLRPIEEAIAEQVPPGTVLWQREQVAPMGAETGRVQVMSEPIELSGDLGLFMACSGPSDVVVTIEPPLPSHLATDGLQPLVSRCRNGPFDLTGGSSDGWHLDQTVRISVESAPDTSWQIVVFDPVPR